MKLIPTFLVYVPFTGKFSSYRFQTVIKSAMGATMASEAQAV